MIKNKSITLVCPSIVLLLQNWQVLLSISDVYFFVFIKTPSLMTRDQNIRTKSA